MTTIRLATLADVTAIAHVHIASWQTTYRGLIPDPVLDTLSLERREQYARSVVSDPHSHEFLYVAETVSGQIVGIASGGPTRDAELPYLGELYVIYLLQSAQRQGLGRKLVTAIAQHLAQQRMSSMLVWVLAENPARRFYEALGGQYVAAKDITMGGKTLREIAYGWHDLQSLIASTTL